MKVGRQWMMKRILCCWTVLLCGLLCGAAESDEPFAVSVMVQKEPDGARVDVSFTVASGSYLNAEELTLTVAGREIHEFMGPEPEQLDGEGVFRKNFTRSYRVRGDLADTLEITVGYQGCLESGMCLMPQKRRLVAQLAADGTKTAAVVPKDGQAAGTAVAARPAVTPEARKPAENGGAAELSALAEQFKVLGSCVGYQPKEDFLSWLEGAQKGEGSGEAVSDNLLARVFRGYGLWLALLLALPLGVLLNLTPCVLPMIPVTLAVIGVQKGEGRRGRGFLLGLAYGAGMALAYGTLGAVVVLGGGRFGSLNANWWFNLAVAVVFVVLGLSQFEMVNVDLSRFRGGQGTAARGRLTGAFLLGALSAILAGACVAPVLLWVLLLATDIYSGGSFAGLLLPFMLGAGMALPWPLVGGGLSRLPRPGSWMVQVRHVFGVLILALALYYGWVGVRQWRGTGRTAQLAEGWSAEVNAGLRQALTERRPVLLDFWGDACKNCVLMDETVLTEAEVKQRLQQLVCVKVKGDEADDAVAQALLQRYDVKGFPTYVLLSPP